MSDALPQRSKTYVGPVNNTTIWETFTLRPDDVIVATPPKCGTTWTQSIVAMLIFGKPGMDIGIGKLSPWIDCGFRDREAHAAILDAQTHRRCIKSHSPLDGITYDPRCTYLAVYRHPMDVHFSMRKHVENMATDLLKDRFPADISEGFRMFLEDETPTGANDDITLDSIVYHYRSFRAWAHLPNVHVLHYADLTRDLPAQLSRIADALGITHPPDVMAGIIEGARFATMQDNARANPEQVASDAFKDRAAFFHSGTSRKWERHLSPDEVARYDARIAELLPPDEVRWLENGSGAG